MESMLHISMRAARSRTTLSSATRVKCSSAYQPRRLLHAGQTQYATPINHPAVTGPPPQPPQVSADQPEAIAARKRKQAELLQRGQALKANPSKPGSALQKRFWKNVSVNAGEDGLQILLDSRPVRTADKQILVLPRSKLSLATAIALEWENLVSAQQALKQHYIPLTSSASRALDFAAADAAGNSGPRTDAIRMMMRYLTTDTLLCWVPPRDDSSGSDLSDSGTLSTSAATGTSLRQRQMEIAEPIIAYLSTHVFPGVTLRPALDERSILPNDQDEATKSIIAGWLMGLPAWELAAVERGVLATKSLLIAVRLAVEWSREFAALQSDRGQERRFGIAEAAEAASVEVTWQTAMWGEVDDTHDVEKEDLARQLGTVVLLVT